MLRVRHRFGGALAEPGQGCPTTRKDVRHAREEEDIGHHHQEGIEIMASREKWSISREYAGTGASMCPPGHPAFEFSIIEGTARRPHFIGSIMSNEEFIPESIRRRAAQLIADATLIESEGWLRRVYGYFRGMYLAPDGGRNVADLLSGKKAAELDLAQPERHAAVVMVREFFPHHSPLTRYQGTVEGKRAIGVAHSYAGRTYREGTAEYFYAAIDSITMAMSYSAEANNACRSTNHIYCVGPCPIRTRNEANASAARTTVETEAECAARIKREDFRVGDPYTFRNLVGYRLYQDRPFACRGVKCQCGKACHGTTVESVEILIDVAHYVSGGLEIQGSKGSRAVIRADRLD